MAVLPEENPTDGEHIDKSSEDGFNDVGGAGQSNVTRPADALRDLMRGRVPALRPLLVMLVLEFAGFSMLIPVVPFFAMQELGLGPRDTGLIATSFACAQLTGTGLCGRISDAVGRRWVIVLAFAWSGGGLGATSMVHSFTALLIVRTIQGFTGGTSALCDSCVLDVVPWQSRPAFLGLVGCTKGVAFVFGPAIGSYLVHAGVPRRAVFLLSGGVALAGSVVGIFFLSETLDRSKRRPLCGQKELSSRDASGEQLSRELVALCVCRFATAAGAGTLFATYAFLIRDFFGWGEAQFGMILFMVGCAVAILQGGVFPHVANRWGAAHIVRTGCLLMVASFLIYPRRSLIAHFLAKALFVLGSACVEPSMPVLVGEIVGPRHIGFGNGVIGACRSFAMAVAPILAGTLYEKSASLAYTVGAMFFLIGAAVAHLVLVSLHDGRERDGGKRSATEMKAREQLFGKPVAPPLGLGNSPVGRGSTSDID